jgi:biuret amidohydrolase
VQQAFGLTIPQTLEEGCDPARTALIVYDMQVGVVYVYTRHMSLRTKSPGSYSSARPWPGNASSAYRTYEAEVSADSPAFQITPELAPDPIEVVFDRITMSAFEGTPLNITLRDCGLIALAIVGIALEVGIEPTVRHRMDLGYIPVVVADACGSRDKAAATRALDSLSFAGGSLQTDVKTICALFKRFRREH